VVIREAKKKKEKEHSYMNIIRMIKFLTQSNTKMKIKENPVAKIP
jgi:hypothetical protein